MIEVSGIRIPVARLNGVEHDELREVEAALARRLHLNRGELVGLELRKRSIDARRRDDVRVTFTVRARLRGGVGAQAELLRRLRCRHNDRGVRIVDDGNAYCLPKGCGAVPDRRVVVVGAGCAGLFCTLALARAGLRPLLVERGDDTMRRGEAIGRFAHGGPLDVESNIQFGLGGAGTFSDGKLATGTKSPAHRFILEELVRAGADRSILWDAHPHVGSDVLPAVVAHIVDEIERAGGEVCCRTCMTDLRVSGGRVVGVTLRATGIGAVTDDRGAAVRAATGDEGPTVRAVTQRDEQVSTSAVVLACGHSARDVFELLKRHGVAIERKPFAMGVRIEHAQAAIDRAQYGRVAGHPALGAAPYKLSCHVDAGFVRRGVFTFCMCPGGYVVAAASERGGVCTNGMSLSGRAGANANAGLLVGVDVCDLPGTDVLAGVHLQRTCEQAAFVAGGGNYVAPAQLVGDFLQDVPSSAAGSVVPTYPRGVAWGSIDSCLPSYVVEALRAGIPVLARRLRGFDAPDAVLTGVETRSSSPVRVVRGDDGQSVSHQGLYPCGEGAGYAGGIMSAAADGLRCAEWLLSGACNGC